MEKNIKVVVGANFGDEGKGLMTDYFCSSAWIPEGKSVLNVRYNGGAQAGHNVVTPQGAHHTFRHFGSGSFNPNVTTYLASEFILNPIIFCKELNELKELGLQPAVVVHPDCRITTPYDMIVNQALERSRGKNRHGSCGLGIDETAIRYANVLTKKISTFRKGEAAMPMSVIRSKLKTLRDTYFEIRIDEIIPDDLLSNEREWLESDVLLDNYSAQLERMLDYCMVCDDNILSYFSHIVFEGAQGLMLDQDYFPFEPHLTSSKPGSYIPKKMLWKTGLQNEKIELCYVTRSYFTRHGAGLFPTECKRSDILCRDAGEPHNKENQFQGTFRVGYFDSVAFTANYVSDSSYALNLFPNAETTAAITHLDETMGKLQTERKPSACARIPITRYLFDGPTRDCGTVVS